MKDQLAEFLSEIPDDERGFANYWGNSRSMIVHTHYCQWAHEMNPDNFVPFDDLQSALFAGYSECESCLGGSDARREYHSMRRASRKHTLPACIVCGETRGIQAAHIVPRRHGGTEVMPLCPNHHWNYDHGLLYEDEEKAIFKWVQAEHGKGFRKKLERGYRQAKADAEQ